MLTVRRYGCSVRLGPRLAGLVMALGLLWEFPARWGLLALSFPVERSW